MTRFARAHCSRGKNTKVPEEATSWKELKEQMRKKCETDIQDLEEQPSRERENVSAVENLMIESKWCDFEDSQNVKFKSKRKKKTKSVNEEEDFVNDNITENSKFSKKKNRSEIESSWCDFEDSSNVKFESKQKKKTKSLNDEECFVNDDVTQDSKCSKKKHRSEMDESSLRNFEDIQQTKRKSKQKKKRISQNDDEDITLNSMVSKKKGKQSFEDESEQNDDFSYKSKKKRKLHSTTSEQELDEYSAPKDTVTGKGAEDHIEENLGDPDWQQKSVELSSTKKRKKNYLGLDNEDRSFNKKSEKERNNKSTESDMSVLIDGKKEKVVKFDNFYVLKKDAERLHKLKEKMTTEKRPKAEIDGVIRRHRRNAEKHLTKMKKKLCFNCREGVHVLSDCPKLGKNDSVGSGLCYKCGSTEHTLYQCKVPGNELKFAKCFICNETGHLSKQCPDNPRGLYPYGGGCRICGDVTHLKRDCPELLKGRRNNSVTVGTIGESIEGLDDDNKRNYNGINSKKQQQKRVNKIIKFV